MRIVRAKQAKKDTRIVFIDKEKAEAMTDFQGGAEETAVRYEDGRTLIWCGLGPANGDQVSVLRSQAARAVGLARELKRDAVSLLVPESGQPEKAGQACLEGVLLGNHVFSQYKSEKHHLIKTCEMVGLAGSAKKIKAVRAACESNLFTRDLVNGNAHEVTPQALAEHARKIGAGKDFTVKVLDEKAIARKGLGLLLAVGQGSDYPPRLITISYKGAPKKKENVALIGKGITFDSGGQNLKTAAGALTMRTDMAGAAAVLGVMRALSELRPKINVTGVVAAAQNAIDSKAYFPGDVYTSYSGKTVEITNTDAEGRLVLADAVSHCMEVNKPTRIIDLATLTGAVLIALGDTVAGLFSNDDDLADSLYQAGEKTGERVWRLPVYPEHKKAMESDTADLRNTAKLKAGYAGAITGAAFIHHFTGDLPWAHLDIAGTAYNEGSVRGETPRFGTGFGVRLLLGYLGLI